MRPANTRASCCFEGDFGLAGTYLRKPFLVGQQRFWLNVEKHASKYILRANIEVSAVNALRWSIEQAAELAIRRVFGRVLPNLP